MKPTALNRTATDKEAGPDRPVEQIGDRRGERNQQECAGEEQRRGGHPEADGGGARPARLVADFYPRERDLLVNERADVRQDAADEAPDCFTMAEFRVCHGKSIANSEQARVPYWPAGAVRYG